jgi:glycosyltransferase involved in cell wall biosynthesis
MSPNEVPQTSLKRLVLVDTGSGLWGGQRYALRLTDFLRSSGFEVVIATQSGSALGDWWTSNGGAVLPLSGRSRPERGRFDDVRKFLLMIRHALTLRRFVQRGQTDVLLSNSNWDHPAVALTGATRRIPSVLILHEEGRAPMIRSFSSRLASHTIAVSAQVAATISGPGRQKTTVVHNGVDTARFQPGAADAETRNLLSSNPDGVIVGCIGRIDRSKHIEDVIHAVTALAPDVADEVSLVCVGSTSDEPKYEQEILSLGQSFLHARFRHLPTRDDIDRLLKNVDIAVFAGSKEGMSLAMLEAMSSGCAVVAYVAAGVEEVIVNDVSGLIIPMGDENGMTRAISSLVAEPERRRLMGVAAQERIRQRFDLESRAGDVVSIIQSVLEKSPKAAS